VQVVELNCVVLPSEVEKVIVPMGLFPITVAVQVVGELTLTVDGEHEIEVAVT